MMTEDTPKKFKAILTRVLEIPEPKVTDALVLESLPSWDSFTALMLVSELESGFDVRFTMDEITTIKSVGDIKKSLQNRNVEV